MSFEIATLLKSVRQRGEQFNETDSDTKQALLDSARELVAALESPTETVLRILTNTPILMASISIAINSGLFHAIASDGGVPKSTSLLAQKIGAEPSFLGRIARHLAAENLIVETGASEYAPTAATHMLTSPAMEGMAKIMIELMAKTLPTLSSFFEENGYKNPSTRNPLQFALNTDESAFQWALRPGNEDLAKAIRVAMTVKDKAPKWYSSVPVEEILGHPNNPDAILLVDIGGNVGNDLLSFNKAFPNLPGRLVLEDLPESVAKLDKKDLEPIEVTGHDFFTPQPISGAKAYYLKTILHDWNDEKCRQILVNIKTVMKPGHSKILINDTVIPDRNAGWYDASQDIMMMLGHGAQERSEGEWRELVGSVGLQITKIWDVKGATEKLIEVDLV